MPVANFRLQRCSGWWSIADLRAPVSRHGLSLIERRIYCPRRCESSPSKHRSLTWHPGGTAGWTLKFSDISPILLLKSEDGFDLNEFGDLDSLEVVKYVTS